MHFKKSFLVLVLAIGLPALSMAQTATVQTERNGKRPDFSKVSFTDIKWKKSEGNAFWFYYGPTLYFFKDTEFETIPLENGDFLVYVYDLDQYLLLPDYTNAKQNEEHTVEMASTRSCVFIRLYKGRFWIFDKGKYVDNLERIGINSVHQVVYRSQRTDKRYWIEESDFSYGPVSKAIGIVSE